MHIEPGILLNQKVIAANVLALSLLGTHLRDNVTSIRQSVSFLPQTIFSALFFCLFMQSFHMKMGYSELHFIGASLMYFTFGFTPTFLGFAFGLLLQGVLFEPEDLYHLGVNSLSLMIPLMVAHYSFGQKIIKKEVFVSQPTYSLKKVLSFDTIFHSGVVIMVGFWLLLGEETVVLIKWAQFAISYVPVVLLDSIFAWRLLKMLSYLSSPNHFFAGHNTVNFNRLTDLLPRFSPLAAAVTIGKKMKRKK